MHTLKGILLVAGTAIGGGMLALPVLTGQAGFFPSILIYLCCWFFMTATGLLLLEVCLRMHPDANLISMAEYTLGKGGKWAAWGLYLFLFYCLTLAYILGSGSLISELLPPSFGSSAGILLFVIVFAPCLFFGSKIVGALNAWLMIGLILLYFGFVFLSISYVKPALLLYQNWAFLPWALPIAFTAFAYQGIIPTLVSYMDRDVKQLRLVILVGTFIPFIVYLIWQTLILGIIPVEGEHGLYQTMLLGHTAVHPLKYYVPSSALYWIGQFFAFLALSTSFLGVALGLQDFLADGLKISKRKTAGKLILLLLVVLPPLMVAFAYPSLFLIALDLAGGIGCALLLGLMPILMAYQCRIKHREHVPQLIGGNWMLVGLSSFVLLELVCQVFVLI